MAKLPALMLGCWLVTSPPPAHASDFWDEVRQPGLRSARQALAAAQASLDAAKAKAALELSEVALRYAPRQPRAHALRGRALWALQRIDDAALSFERAVQLDPAALDEAGIEGAAHAAALTARLALAEQLATRALEHLPPGPRRGVLIALLGDVLSAMGPERLRDAEAAYRQALAAARSLELRAGLGLALCLDRAGERHAASKVLTSLPGLDGVQSEMLRWPLQRAERAARHALVLDSAGDAEAARALWQAVADDAGPWASHALQKLARGAR